MTSDWRSLVLWSVVALVIAATAVSFLLWGLNGPAYLVELIQTYCF